MLQRIRDILADQGGFALTVSKVRRAPKKALLAGLQVLKSSWPKLLLSSEADWQRLRAELQQDGFLRDRQRVLLEYFRSLGAVTVRDHKVVPGHVRTLHAELIYAVVRHRQPDIVVETGVCNGLSSAIILKAMATNNHGRLHSIDLPEFTDPKLNSEEFWEGKAGAAIPAGKRPGWLVEDQYAGRWKLTLGRSQDVLQPLLDDIGPIDIFIHDSEHSFANQILEFNAGFRALKSGGVLIATDINWTSAFSEFHASIQSTGAKVAFVDANCAIVLKMG